MLSQRLRGPLLPSESDGQSPCRYSRVVLPGAAPLSLPLPRCCQSRSVDISHWSLRSRDVYPCERMPGHGRVYHPSSHRPAPPSTALPHTLLRLPTLRNIIQLRSSNLLVVVTLSSFTASANPITPRDLPAFSEAPSLKSSRMDHQAIFGIVFVLGLFLLIEVGYACIGFRVRFTRFIEVSSSILAAICDTSDIVMQRLSSFRVFKFIKKAADACVAAYDVSAASPTLPTHGGSGGPGNFSTISHSA